VNERPRGGELIAAAKGADRDGSRLKHLYEVSKLLTRFGDVEPTLFAVINVVRRALPLRSAIFILDAERSRRTIVWHADGVSTE
jgi:hypothetical protein